VEGEDRGRGKIIRSRGLKREKKKGNLKIQKRSKKPPNRRILHTHGYISKGLRTEGNMLEALYCAALWCLQRGATSVAGEEGPPGP
jgi:hypothetical protein